MALRITIRIPCSCASRFVLLLAALLSLTPVATADPTDSARVGAPQSHQEFVDSCLRELSRHVVSGFTPHRTSPLLIVPDSIGDPARTIASELTLALSERGLLIREDSAASTEDGNWSVRYSLSPIQLTLTEPERREFLGKIWVKRTLHAELDMTVQDVSLGDVVWAGAADSTYFDWIPKNALKSLESPDLKPKVPATGWEKAKLPIIIGGGVLAAAILVLALN